MQDITLGTVDLAIVAGYFLLVFSIGFNMARRTRSAEDLFLAGAAYTWGIAVANYEWMAARSWWCSRCSWCHCIWMRALARCRSSSNTAMTATYAAIFPC